MSKNGTEQRPKAIVILGGGVAGLTAGLELRRRGWPVTILERGREVGGLARTIQHGQFRFDIGGHRFHSDNPRLLRWLEALLGNDLLRVARRSHIYLKGQFIPYPLQFPGAFRIFSPGQMARVLGSYLTAQAHSLGPAAPAVSFEDWVVNRFGRTLYEIYFKPYTEKVWGIPCHELSADWAAQRISLPSLLATIRHTVYVGRKPPATIASRFYYPRCGFGMIPSRMADEVIARGGTIHTRATVNELMPSSEGFTVVYEQDGQQFSQDADQVISTIPIDALLRALPEEEQPQTNARLAYRDLICVFLAVDQPQISRDHWTYFPQSELLFGRIHEPKNWSSALTPNGMSSLVVEIFTGREEATWHQPDDALVAQTVEQLEQIKFLCAARIADTRVLRIPNAYPIYRVGYEAHLSQVRRYLDRFPHLHLVGRTGAFRYLNSDGVMEGALALVDYLTGHAPAYVDVNEHYFVP